MLQRERKFGEIPSWAKSGAIDARNYAFRAEAYCAAVSITRSGGHPTVRRGSDAFWEWYEYFVWLGRIPVAFQRLIDEPHSEREFSVPEEKPEDFDTRFTPTKGWRPWDLTQAAE